MQDQAAYPHSCTGLSLCQLMPINKAKKGEEMAWQNARRVWVCLDFLTHPSFWDAYLVKTKTNKARPAACLHPMTILNN